jgi:ABC-2 type transport system permease protein
VRSQSSTRLVARREVSERIGGRTLRITTAVMTVLVVAGVTIPGLVSSSSGPTRIALVGPPAQALAPALTETAQAAKQKLELLDFTDPQAARAAVKRGVVDVALDVGPSGATAEVKQSLSSGLRALLALPIDAEHQRALLTGAGVSEATVRAAQTPVPFTTTAVAPPPPQKAARDVAAIAAGLVLYIVLVMYGNAVATGVAQEKTSRTAEVLLATVRPGQLLTGKVVGIGVCGLAQLSIPVIAGLIANAIVQSAKIPSSVWAVLPAALLWFVLGYALYAYGYAAAGATVARQEEVQFATTPFAFPLLAAYLLVYALIGSPDSPLLRVLSFLPPLAPAMMPARIAIGGLAWWETPLAVALMLVSIYGMIRLASRVYAGALMRGGARLDWRSALQLGR